MSVGQFPACHCCPFPAETLYEKRKYGLQRSFALSENPLTWRRGRPSITSLVLGVRWRGEHDTISADHDTISADSDRGFSATEHDPRKKYC